MNVLQVVFMYVASVPSVLTVRASAVLQNDPGALHKKELEMVSLSTNLSSESKEKITPTVLQRTYSWLKARNFLLQQVLVLFSLLLLILIIEDDRFRSDLSFDLFNVIFEVASAYGTVGLTKGYPGTIPSLVAQFTDGSKVVMCLICVLGRHRGLPTSLDSAYTFKLHYTNNSSKADEIGGAEGEAVIDNVMVLADHALDPNYNPARNEKDKLEKNDL